MSIVGWGAWRNGRLHDRSVTYTKRDLLIGYDMMPLRGLGKTERFLAERGICMRRTRVSVCPVHRRHGYALQRDGRIDPGSLAWTVSRRRRRDSMEAAFGYVGNLHREEPEIRKPLYLAQYLRRRNSRFVARAERVLQRLGWELVPVRFEAIGS